MSIQPKDLLDLARSLVSDDEVRNRCAISRAYYAALHHSRPLASTLPVPPDTKGSHEEVIGALQKLRPADHLTVRGIGHLLNQLKGMRTTADYSCNSNVSKTAADQAIEQATEIMKRLDALYHVSQGTRT